MCLPSGPVGSIWAPWERERGGSGRVVGPQLRAPGVAADGRACGGGMCLAGQESNFRPTREMASCMCPPDTLCRAVVAVVGSGRASQRVSSPALEVHPRKLMTRSTTFEFFFKPHFLIVSSKSSALANIFKVQPHERRLPQPPFGVWDGPRNPNHSLPGCYGLLLTPFTGVGRFK